MKIQLAKSGLLVFRLVLAIAITLLFGNLPGSSHESSSQPSTTSTSSSMRNSTLQWNGLIEPFAVTKLKSPLPGLKSGTLLPGIRFPDLGQQHIEVGKLFSYNSNPPTSGPHYPYPAPWGIYIYPPADEFLVHNLEHGGVIISYNPNQIKGQELVQLWQQARSLSKFNGRIIVTPRLNLDTAIALTAWNYLQKLDRYSYTAVQVFYDTHISRGPECQQGLCPL
ncbi:DUF3105 domain-containing protein [Nostoc sp. CHAB 5836]|uniref:DUF3105 domain-containing protein n=1 Tax=Nostoc sp. CHAB 5836 TaxID=2780404 RepID=UPI001E5DE0E0|nr:DUF3105 domain-containing protein [Nostoc sp. CHAB 5836]MCC5614017.1 DUF3105 domain-containing protein [Nostoc sp. CHAB 5836]